MRPTRQGQQLRRIAVQRVAAEVRAGQSFEAAVRRLFDLLLARWAEAHGVPWPWPGHSRDSQDHAPNLDLGGVSLFELGALYPSLLPRGAGRGAHYTPEPLVRALVERAVGPALDAHLAAGHPPLGFRVLDPAMGTGHFLLASADLIAHRSGADARLIAERCLYGVDLDPLAVQLARQLLGLHCGARRSNVRVADGLHTKGRFQAVVGNPPWLAHSGRQARPLAPRPPLACLGGWPATHAFFLERSVDRLGQGGRLGLVLPAAVADLAGFRPVRGVLAARGRVDEPCAYHGERVFRGVLAPTISVVFARGPASPGQEQGWRVGDEQPLGGPLAELLERLGGLEPFGAAAFGDPGVHTGNCAQELLSGPDGVPLREGRDVRAFRVATPSRLVRLDLPRQAGKYFRIAAAERYLGCPILVRQTADRPIAALHAPAAFFRNSLLACYGLPDVPHAATVAILNSQLIGWLFRRRHRDVRQRAFPQVKVGALRGLPRPPVQDRATLRALADCGERLSRGAADPATEGLANRLVLRLYGVSEELFPSN